MEDLKRNIEFIRSTQSSWDFYYDILDDGFSVMNESINGSGIILRKKCDCDSCLKLPDKYAAIFYYMVFPIKNKRYECISVISEFIEE